MQTRNRRHSVMEALRQNKTVAIAELAEQLNVSTMTIRRDLKRLADQCVVTLTHGGAVLNEGTAATPNVGVREQQRQKEKNSIAAFCASLVKEGNSIYIDTGSTPMNIAEALLDKQNIAVLTHSLAVMNILANTKNIQLIAMPGIYHAGTKGFFGSLTEQVLDKFRLDIAFLGSSGINLEYGVMSPKLYELGLKQVILARAAKKVLVVDHEKLGQMSFFKICDLTTIDMIVTTKSADSDLVAKIRRLGVEVVQV